MTAVSTRIVKIYTDAAQVQPYALQCFSRFTPPAGTYNNTDYIVVGYNQVMSTSERYYIRLMSKLKLDTFFKKPIANYYDVRVYDEAGNVLVHLNTITAEYFPMQPYKIYTIAVNYLSGIPGLLEALDIYSYYSPNTRWFFQTDWEPSTSKFLPGMSSTVNDQWDNLRINFVNVTMTKNEILELAIVKLAITSGTVQIQSSDQNFILSYTQPFTIGSSVLTVVRARKSGKFTGSVLCKILGAGPGESVAVPLAMAFENISASSSAYAAASR